MGAVWIGIPLISIGVGWWLVTRGDVAANAWALPLAIGIGMVVALVVGGIVFLTAWRPLSEVIRATGDLADGDYTARVLTPTGPSAAVGRSFNRMADRLANAEDQRRQLLADVGHELRTPLAVIRAEVEAMQDGVHAPTPEVLSRVEAEIAVLERLIEDLRTLSLAEAGSIELQIEPTDVHRLLDDVATGLRQADASGAAVTWADDDEAIVPADPVRLREVFSNLLSNALRATSPQGTITLSCVSQPDSVLVTITDDGTGMTEDELAAAFQRFRKGPNSTGTGIGLTIARSLVEAHGGELSLDSTLGEGTVATVRLPR